MDENLTVAELSKLAGTKTEAILAGLQALGKRTKDAVGTVSGSNVAKASDELAKSRRVHSSIKANKGTTTAKKRKKKFKQTAAERVGRAEANLSEAKVKQRKGRLALGGAAAATLGIAGIAKAMKRGSKAAPMMGKKDKLIKAMKKNPKTTAAVAGGTGAVGLASLLKDK